MIKNVTLSTISKVLLPRNEVEMRFRLPRRFWAGCFDQKTVNTALKLTILNKFISN